MRDDQLVLTASPDFTDFALRELHDIAPGATVLATLEPGVLWMELGQSFWEVAEAWRVAPPIFVRHICPVQHTLPLTGQPSDLDELRGAVQTELADLIEPELPFSVQARTFCELSYKRFDINNALAEAVQQTAGAPLDVRAPLQVLSVVCGNDGTGDPDEWWHNQALLGVSPTVYNLSDWAGGMRRFAREDAQVSRSEFKLLEALEVFDIPLPARGVALDLGAAPGGWTRILRLREQYVTAVDPGELHPSIAADRSVRHMHMTAEEYLRNEPDTFDAIVNDMRIDADESARLMVDYAAHLYRDAFALVTLKLPEHGRRSLLAKAMRILEEAYTIAGARQLFHNRSEITVYLKPTE